MPHTDLFAIASWPLIALAFLLGMIARYTKSLHKRTHTVFVAVTMGLLLIALAILVAMFRASTLMVADEYVFMIAIGLMLVLMRPARAKAVYRLSALVIGLACFGYGVWKFIGDFVLSREEIAGVVTRIDPASPAGLGATWRRDIEVDGRRYETTGDLFALAEDGRRVHATIGRGSGMILGLETLPY